MTTQINIGDTLWRFDYNRRVYKDNKGAPIYAEHFVEYKVIGETPKSWLVERGGKVSKKDLHESNGKFSGYQWFTDEGKAADIWAHEHRYEIVELVRRCDVGALKKIAEVVGYTP